MKFLVLHIREGSFHVLLSGLFSPGHLEYFTESADAQNPTLEEMTKVAISRLQKNDKGFVLLVEGTIPCPYNMPETRFFFP